MKKMLLFSWLSFCLVLAIGLDQTNANVSISGDTFTNSLGMTFIRIPAGTFMMGSPDNEIGRDSDETQHTVTVGQDYYIQTTEVTQGQWTAVMGSNPSYFTTCGPTCPVENISWYYVQEFISKLNQMGEGTYVLPSEIQWEYADRAGAVTAFYNGPIVQPWGQDPYLDEVGWYSGNSSTGSYYYYWGETHPAEGKLPNARGLYDMLGNVSEWVSDWYADYPSGTQADPQGSIATSSNSGAVKGQIPVSGMIPTLNTLPMDLPAPVPAKPTRGQSAVGTLIMPLTGRGPIVPRPPMIRALTVSVPLPMPSGRGFLTTILRVRWERGIGIIPIIPALGFSVVI